jgi:uridine phosphorylase
MTQHHIGLDTEHLRGNDGLGRVVLLPGSRARAATIGARFDGLTVIDNPRGHTAHLGTITEGGRRIDVLAIASGMGTPSTEIVAHELLAIGARRVVRVGSCGSLDANVRAGDVVILSGAVRDEMSSRHIAPVELPAVAHPDAVAAMVAGARAAGLDAHAFVGMGHSKASFYAREFGMGPMGEENRAYMRLLARCGVLATEMGERRFCGAGDADLSRPRGGPGAGRVRARCVCPTRGRGTAGPRAVRARRRARHRHRATRDLPLGVARRKREHDHGVP